MGLFNKKKDDESLEQTVQETVEKAQTETPAQDVESKNSSSPEPIKEKTPEQLKEEQAIRLSITAYNDGQVTVENLQNCDSRSKAMYLCFLALLKYMVTDISGSTVQTMINVFAQQQKGSNIIVPGSRR